MNFIDLLLLNQHSMMKTYELYDEGLRTLVCNEHYWLELTNRCSHELGFFHLVEVSCHFFWQLILNPWICAQYIQFLKEKPI